MGGRRARTDTTIADRRRLVAGLYARRKTEETIAYELNVAQSTVSRDIAALKQQWRKAAAEDIADVIAQELAELDASEANLAEFAEDAAATASTRIAAEVARLKVKDHRAKLLGMYAAQRLQVTGKEDGPISLTDYRSELAAALNKINTCREVSDMKGGHTQTGRDGDSV